jgi:hypothetical protein
MNDQERKAQQLVERQNYYSANYSKIIVKYQNNSKKVFTPDEWALFEDGVRKVAKNIRFVSIRKTSFWKRLFGIG